MMYGIVLFYFRPIISICLEEQNMNIKFTLEQAMNAQRRVEVFSTLS
jgi:hypothetical protein